MHCEFPKLCCSICDKALSSLPSIDAKHDAPPLLEGEKDEEDDHEDIRWYHEYVESSKLYHLHHSFVSCNLPALVSHENV